MRNIYTEDGVVVQQVKLVTAYDISSSYYSASSGLGYSVSQNLAPTNVPEEATEDGPGAWGLGSCQPCGRSKYSSGVLASA